MPFIAWKAGRIPDACVNTEMFKSFFFFLEQMVLIFYRTVVWCGCWISSTEYSFNLMRDEWITFSFLVQVISFTSFPGMNLYICLLSTCYREGGSLGWGEDGVVNNKMVEFLLKTTSSGQMNFVFTRKLKYFGGLIMFFLIFKN